MTETRFQIGDRVGFLIGNYPKYASVKIVHVGKDNIYYTMIGDTGATSVMPAGNVYAEQELKDKISK